MKELQLFNTLGREKQAFKPLNKQNVTVYHCGPTVYWTQHIGNMRAAFFGDIVNRSLRQLGYKVTFVRNYTDVGHLSGDNEGDADSGIDRMEKAAKREMKTPEEIAAFYKNQFDTDLEKLQVITPDHRPAATDYIDAMIHLTTDLLQKGFAYQTDLAIYFDTSKKDDYYKLSGQNKDMLQSGHGHGNVSDEKKKNSSDFALWFFKSGSHEHALQTWSNPFSSVDGFPGWHIECSAMIKDILGDSIDIHLGGIEHITIHHTNEIAQSESANNKSLANYWLHNEHLDVNGGKMSKSDGTSFSISDVEDAGFDAIDLRYFFLQAHYRSKQNFTWDALQASATALERLKSKIKLLPQGGTINEVQVNNFLDCIKDDFNTAGALAVISDVLKSDISDADKRATIMEFNKVLGLNLHESKDVNVSEVPEDIKDLLQQRKEAREVKNWQLTDDLRDQIASLGYIVLDTADGQKIEKLDN